MRILLVGIALASSAAITAPANAQNAAAGGTSPTTVQVTAEPEKRICKREQSVGTRLSRAICLTRSEWKARDRENDEQRSRINDKMNNAPTERMQPGEATGSSG
jgi:hypothetical protein